MKHSGLIYSYTQYALCNISVYSRADINHFSNMFTTRNNALLTVRYHCNVQHVILFVLTAQNDTAYRTGERGGGEEKETSRISQTVCSSSEAINTKK